MQLERRTGVLFLPKLEEQGWQPATGQPGELVDAGVTAGAKRDQMGRLVASGFPVVHVRSRWRRPAGGATALITLQDEHAQAPKAAARVSLLLAATGAERGSEWCGEAAEAEEGALQEMGHSFLLACDKRHYNMLENGYLKRSSRTVLSLCKLSGVELARYLA